MFVVVWMFHVRPEREREFVSAYSPGGEWAELFKRDENYRGTELLQDAAVPQRYVTIDRWTSSEAYESFLRRWQQDYDVLDRRCDLLTEQEMKIGEYRQTGN